MNQTTDNNLGQFFVREEDLKNFEKIDRVKISELFLAGSSDLLVFPENLDKYGDKIGQDYVFELNKTQLTTNNIMGFIGVNGSELKIRSRFSQEDKADYFLHYMLEKVFAINLFDLKHSSASEDIFDFLLYLFPYYLKKALKQGLFKEYQNKNYNDANIRGRVNINKHIRKNMPFAGNVAYTVREYSYDNYLTQLIRHTVEFIAEKEVGYQILNNDKETSSAIAQIKSATPTYRKGSRRQVLFENSRPFAHPFFTEYISLKKICQQILSYQGLKFGEEKDKIYGILFNGAWLWEEYLNTFLKPLDLKHPENNTGRGRITLFTNNKGHRYPDFYNEKMVLDAKYKRLQDNWVDRNDMHQIISYLYVLKVQLGGLIGPIEENSGVVDLEPKIGELKGYGGRVFIWRLLIPESVESYKEFKEKMKCNEEDLLETVKSSFLH